MKPAARLSAEKAVLEKELEKTTASPQPISVTDSKLLWSTRYGLLFLFHCCLTSSVYGLLASISAQSLEEFSKYAELTEKLPK